MGLDGTLLVFLFGECGGRGGSAILYMEGRYIYTAELKVNTRESLFRVVVRIRGNTGAFDLCWLGLLLANTRWPCLADSSRFFWVLLRVSLYRTKKRLENVDI